MQTDQAMHETGQYDALLGALNETKASLGSVLKAAPGIWRQQAHAPPLAMSAHPSLLHVAVLASPTPCTAASLMGCTG